MQQDQRVEQASKRGIVEQPAGKGTFVALLLKSLRYKPSNSTLVFLVWFC